MGQDILHIIQLPTSVSFHQFSIPIFHSSITGAV
jgi:hypothetical protein